MPIHKVRLLLDFLLLQRMMYSSCLFVPWCVSGTYNFAPVNLLDLFIYIGVKGLLVFLFYLVLAADQLHLTNVIDSFAWQLLILFCSISLFVLGICSFLIPLWVPCNLFLFIHTWAVLLKIIIALICKYFILIYYIYIKINFADLLVYTQVCLECYQIIVIVTVIYFMVVFKEKEWNLIFVALMGNLLCLDKLQWVA